MDSASHYQLLPAEFEKIWGSTQLEPWFPNANKKIGEIWFREPNSPLLIKFLFTTENLSVQVHPNDQQAAEMEPGCCGKTEMWHILKAEPGAKLAMGLKAPMGSAELRAACIDGSVMERLRWVPAVAGETWFIPAGTIHAIGGGITLAEVQQNSDVTYRLYDYGRARELHLEKGLAVSDLESRPEAAGNSVNSPYFHAEVIHYESDMAIGPGLFIVTGPGSLGGNQVHQGQVWRLLEPLVTSGGCGIVVSGGC